jgi:lipopolysaccharide heptosyltransferase II
MATPALAAIAESLPGARLTLLASPGGAALAPHLPMVEEAIAWRAPWVRHPGTDPSAFGPDSRRLVAELAARRFDAAVIFTTCTQSPLPAAFLCGLAGIGLRLAHCRENPYRLLTDWVPETDTIATGMRHEVRRQLDLVARIGCTIVDQRLRFRLDAAAHANLAAAWQRIGFEPRRRYVVVHPGASAASRRWPAERFGAAADVIALESGRAIVFCGAASEHPFIEQARRAMRGPSWSLGGEVDLGGLGALLAGADLLVANNSGPVHVACAVGTPVVDLYALTNPQHTPWGVPARVLSHDVPCRHCLKSTCPQGHHDCLRGVAAPTAAQATLELLALEGGGAAPGRARPLELAA